MKKPDKRSAGRLSRVAMIMAGRAGRRPINTAYFVSHRQRILAAWSRTNLEGRIGNWTAKRVLPSMFVSGVLEYGDIESRFTETDGALWRAILWQR